MTKSQRQMTKETRKMKIENEPPIPTSVFGIRHSDFFRHSSFPHVSSFTFYVLRFTHLSSIVLLTKEDHVSRFTSIKHPRMHIRSMHRGMAARAPTGPLA